jgi:uncharacterized protein YegP (UPF0339 family)
MALDAARFETFEDGSEGWRWRLRAKNGEIDAMATQSYRDEADARRAIGDVEMTVREASGQPVFRADD